MITKIRHCGIVSDDHDRAVKFYKTIFGFRQFTNWGGDERTREDRPKGQISDGVIGLALNPHPAGFRSGLDHFGLQLQDIKLVVDRLKEYYPDTIITKALEGVAFVALRIHDPVGSHIDLAQEGGPNLRDGYSRGESWESPRHLHHIAIRARKPTLLAEFYKRVFELTEVKNLSGEGGICLTDGQSYLFIRPCENYSYRVMSQGLDHIGFKVENLEKVKKELEELKESHPEYAPTKIHVGRNGPLLQRDIDSCSLGQFATSDPDHVLIDITEQ